MRALLPFMVLVPLVAPAQHVQRFQQALSSNNEKALDRWMGQEIHRLRKGHLVTTPSTSYIIHHPTYDSLVAFLLRQPGVDDAAWDKCIGKIAIWPGQSTIGLRWYAHGQLFERCWTVQEGIPGTIDLAGWRPRIRKDRQHLKYLGAADRPGFAYEQRIRCARAGH